jgi:hypothetical protein
MLKRHLTLIIKVDDSFRLFGGAVRRRDAIIAQFQ